MSEAIKNSVMILIKDFYSNLIYNRRLGNLKILIPGINMRRNRSLNKEPQNKKTAMLKQRVQTLRVIFTMLKRRFLIVRKTV